MSFPKVVTIETVADCNLHCRYCSVHQVKGSRTARFMNLSLLSTILSECKAYNPYIWIDYMGEPTLHPEFIHILDILNGTGLSFAMESNATLWNDTIVNGLAESKMDRIIVTLEPNQKLFSKYRSSNDFGHVVTCLKEFARKRKNNTKLELQMIINPENNALTDEFKRLCDEIGADKSFVKPIMVHQFESNEAYKDDILSNLWSNDILSRYEMKENGEVSLPELAMKSQCPKLEETVVLADGRMVMCCYDKQGKHCLGSLHEQSLEDLWNQSAEFRNSKMKTRSFNFCKYCLEGSYDDMIVTI